jgi:hypothetical protein
MFSTDPERRKAFTAGLRQLADFIDANPRVPVPGTETEIVITASDAEEGGIAEILALSIELATSFAEHDGFYRTARKFGPVTYKGVCQTRAALAQFRAYNSYYGSVTPDD